MRYTHSQLAVINNQMQRRLCLYPEQRERLSGDDKGDDSGNAIPFLYRRLCLPARFQVPRQSCGSISAP